ncbi:hypothetical protein SLEP1_g23672 [Rubroshorea leprosula]|uniref:Uncharacterized protein n=1 Tax=Rubroshorea leprosula TaxID=152421 RepID=A0AAV5JKE2_9ROSI|nr:hypothetical protein SLEP1_g23672 [Rubroshorea leprosula]
MEEVDLSLKLGVFSGPFGVFSGPLRSRVSTVISSGTVLLAHLSGLHSIV